MTELINFLAPFLSAFFLFILIGFIVRTLQLQSYKYDIVHEIRDLKNEIKNIKYEIKYKDWE